MKSFINRSVFILPILNLISISTTAQNSDTIKVYWLEPIEVSASRYNWHSEQFPFERDNISTVIRKSGFSFIRKGNFFANDLYADGMKRGDISIVIDGERFPNACPNRMDSPITRVNPFEMSKINLVKTGAAQYSGLGGLVSFERDVPGDLIELRGGISNSFDRTNGYDAVLSFNALNNRITGRYSKGSAYEDADERSFKELYNYRENFSYYLKEISLHGKINDFQYGAAFSSTKDILFPYLLMDERINELVNAFFSYKGHKVYFNHTYHVMDSDLRANSMFMETRAKNTTIGLTGNSYEVFFRNWDADNWIKTQMGTLDNHLMPDLNQLSLNLNRSLKFGGINISGTAGIVHFYVDDKTSLENLKTLYNNARDKITYYRYGLGVSYSQLFNDELFGSILAEINSEPPAAENLFTNVQKPMNKPTWLGNPDLTAPVKTTLRTMLQFNEINFEIFGSFVWNYVNLAKTSLADKLFLTYENIDAGFIGFSVSGSYKIFDFNASYTAAENISNKKPMPEIQPFTIESKLNLPELLSLNSFISLTYSDAQVRIDESLNETKSESWYRVDIGTSYKIHDVLISLTAENLTNQLYSQHLSYLRDPFTSGMKIFEPGRTIRLSVHFSEIFN